MTSRPIVALVLACCATGACSSSSGSSPATGDDGGSSVLPPPAAGQGIQLKFATTIAASSEDERCQFVQTTEDMWINSETIRYTPGSHHFLLWHTPYQNIPTADNSGKAVDTSGVFECIDGPNTGWNVDQIIGGAQAADAPPIVGNLPSDTALHILAGSVLIMDLHVLNAAAKPFDTEVLMNLNTIPQSQVKQEAGVYFFYNPFIRVPADGSSHARMSCPVTSDVTLANLQTHMHKQGLGGVVNLVEPTGSMMQMYESHVWTDPPVSEFQPGMALQAGQAIDYECNYQNMQNVDVLQGPTAAHNEMCVLIGSYYPRDLKFEDCSASGGWAYQGTGATFIGTGTATGAATYACYKNAESQQQASNYTDLLYGCVVDSCPGIAKPLSAFILCAFKAGSNTDAACGAEASAVQAAGCN